MKSFKKYLIILILLILYILIYSISYANSTISNISNNLFRLHVIANSDSDDDQNLKYAVRDNLINYMNNICINVSSKQDALNIANEHLYDFYKIAENTIIKHGYYYNVKISIGNYSFPTKKYGDISLPAGYYDALKVEIGEAKGKNWWCVMFPSLCFVDVSNGVVPEESKKDLQNSLSEEDFNLISSSNSQYQFKFKLIELLENAKILTAKK